MPRPLADLLEGPWVNGLDSAAIAHFWEDCPVDVALRLRPQAVFLDSIISASHYLRGLLRHHGGFAADCLAGDPRALLRKLCAEASASAFLGDTNATGRVLRRCKARVALLVALADLGRAWSVDEVTAALTEFADAATSAAVNALLLEAQASSKLALPDGSNPGFGSGFVVLAMGKHGAGELNYSSDIDLIVLFYPETAPMAGGTDAAQVYIRITKKLVVLLQDVTEDGYVFRVDLRLRPDPRATQVAIAMEAAAHYYENLGQNWERAAYIKARPVAGDLTLGAEFLGRLKPYVWRKHLDFASIADVQSLIRQIHAVKGHGEIAVEGHNLKLGRGGIREIEFFVQTQQLIAGGRNVSLRGRGTIAMLEALEQAKWIEQGTAAELSDCYRFLRKLEHRAQMVDDQQTHLVPAEASGFENYARLSGFPDGAALAAKLRATLETVKTHSSRLFPDSGSLGSDLGSLVFTGGEDDPDTIATLTHMGFAQASETSATIRGWHFGRFAATRTRAAREILTELMPALLKALSASGDADRSFQEFDRFLAGLPAGLQLFAMLKANPGLLDLIAKILGTAPRLAEQLGKQPRILEAVLEPGFFGLLPPKSQINDMAETLLPAGLPLEEAMDRARVLAREQQFRVGVRVLSDTLSAEDAGTGFANVADVIITSMLKAAMADMQQRHGSVAGARIAVIAMGKLGGREMTASSDLDLVVVYDHAVNALQSDGLRPLSAGQYFARATQRFIAGLTAPTAEGAAFEVDMRLRPSGSKGPVAVNFASFMDYQSGSAWTWEKLALTRARPMAGDESLMAELRAAIATSLSAERERDQTRNDVVDMRRLMLKEHKPESVWDLKRARGGLVELEFIAQYLQLIHAHAAPAILSTNTADAYLALECHGFIESATATQLRDALQLYNRLTQVLRLCLAGPYDPASSRPGLNRAIAIAAAMPTVDAAEALLGDHQDRVSGLFDHLLGNPD